MLQYLLRTKPVSKLGIDKNFLNLKEKSICVTTTICLRLKCFPQVIRNKTRCFLLFLLKMVLVIQSSASCKKKKNNVSRQEEVNLLSSYSWHGYFQKNPKILKRLLILIRVLKNNRISILLFLKLLYIYLWARDDQKILKQHHLWWYQNCALSRDEPFGKWLTSQVWMREIKDLKNGKLCHLHEW